MFRKLIDLLHRSQQRQALVLIALIFFGMILETAGIGLILPALSVMVEQDFLASRPNLASFLQEIGITSQRGLIAGAMLGLIALYGFKASYLAFMLWKESKFVYNLQAELSRRLFGAYLRRPYGFHLQSNSAQLLRNVLNETKLLATIGIKAALTLLVEVSVITGIGMLLLIIEPMGALIVMALLLVASVGFHWVTHGFVQRIGEDRLFHEGLRVQHLQQGFGGVKEIKLMGREEDFLSQYNRHNIGSSWAAMWKNILKQLPRLWLEFLAVVGMAALVLVLLAQERPLATLIPTLGLFGAAGFRMMPSANRIIASVQSLRYALPVVHVIHSELHGSVQEVERTDTSFSSLLPFNKMLILDNVTFYYPDSDSAAITEINVSIPQGASVGVIGSSGAGKSTLVDVILGLLPPTEGRVLVDGVDIQENLVGWQRQIGYVPQEIYLTDDTLRRNIALGIGECVIDNEAVRRALQAAQLYRFVEELPRGVDTVVGERGVRLSGGQRQRIGIARALYHDPSVLILDEATSSLDVATEQGVMESVRALRSKKTVLIVSHRMVTVEHCDRIYRLEGGSVIQEGRLSELTLG